jgi:hypothetical protein
MSMQGDWAREDITQIICKKLKEKMEKYPASTPALKEIGNEMLNLLPNVPDWADDFHQLFR